MPFVSKFQAWNAISLHQRINNVTSMVIRHLIFILIEISFAYVDNGK